MTERDEPAGQGPGERRVPITLLAGFLGSGKTTLLNRLLAGRHGVRVAVLVNDFGSIDVDGRLIESDDATVLTLDNGCICCSISGDLVAQLTALLEGPARPEHVLIEASGVTDPGRLLVALRDAHLRSLARVDAVVTLIDAANVDSIPPTAVELVRRQLAAADVIVFNKADLVAPDRLADLRHRLTYPRARTVDATYGDVPLDILLGIDRDALAHEGKRNGTRVARQHDNRFSTWTWTSSEPLAYAAVRQVLATLPPGIYRAKGFLRLAEWPDEQVVAHVVGQRVDLRPLGPWDDRERRTELVFIGLGVECDPEDVARRLAATSAVPA